MPSVLQHASGTVTLTSGTSGTVTASFASNIAAGSAVVACITARESGFGSPSISSVKTGTLAENWALPSGASDTASGVGSLLAAIWVNPASAGGSKVINVALAFSGAMSGTNVGTAGLDIYEVGSVAASSPADKVHAASQSAVTSWSSGATATTSQATEIAFGVAGFTNSSITMTVTGPASPWTNEATLGSISSGHYQKSGFDVLSSTGAVTFSGTNSVAAGVATVVVTLLGGGATGTGSARIPKPGALATAAESVPSSGSARLPKPGPHAAAAEIFPSHGSARLPKMAPHATAAEVFSTSGGVRIPKPGPHASGAVGEDAAFMVLPKMGLHATVAVEATGGASAAIPKMGLHGTGQERIPSAGSARLPKPSVAALAFEGDNATGSVRIPKFGLHASGVNAEQAIGGVMLPKPALHVAAAESFPLHGSVLMRKMTLSGTAGQQPAGLASVSMPKMAMAGGSGRVVLRFLFSAPDKLSRSGGTMEGAA